MYCNNFVTLNPSLDWLIFLLTQLKKKVLLVNGSVLLEIHPEQ